MAMHEIPQDGTTHTPAPDCPCRVRRRWQGGRYVHVHTDRAAWIRRYVETRGGGTR
ncbi:hypothetical protein Acsp01_86220 [Actinoplanes sp. NBRC 101535]|nr:hypothetical protein Acsp01_86220 [Actinoplanes sp. NBRC 101535]